MTWIVEVLNPKAEKLLRDLEDLDLIQVKSDGSEMGPFQRLADSMSFPHDGSESPSLEEIVEDVKAVRAERYATGRQ